MSCHQRLCAIVVAMISASAVAAENKTDIEKRIEVIRQVGPKGLGNREARAAWKELASSDASHLPTILGGMDQADILATNWLRAAIDSIAERTLRDGGKLPVEVLQKLLDDKKHSPQARRTAFELVTRNDPALKERLVPQFLNDPSLELRRDAVAGALVKALELEKGSDKAATIAAYKQTLSAARDVDQIKAAHDKLKELGEQVDLAAHYGFINTWKIIGPFDNPNMRDFATVYPPEAEFKPAVKYAGKLGEVSWTDYATKDDFGMVDFNKALDKHKAAIAYAITTFVSKDSRDMEVRLGSPNANKIWLNGELLTANEIYHLGKEIDQYRAQGRLRVGNNTILVKLCQNEQTEEWSQDWQFQLRVCDEVGTAILSADRSFNPAPQATASPTLEHQRRTKLPSSAERD